MSSDSPLITTNAGEQAPDSEVHPFLKYSLLVLITTCIYLDMFKILYLFFYIIYKLIVKNPLYKLEQEEEDEDELEQSREPPEARDVFCNMMETSMCTAATVTGLVGLLIAKPMLTLVFVGISGTFAVLQTAFFMISLGKDKEKITGIKTVDSGYTLSVIIIRGVAVFIGIIYLFIVYKTETRDISMFNFI